MPICAVFSSFCLIHQEILTDIVWKLPLLKEKLQAFNSEIIPPRPPFCPEVAFKLEHSVIQFQNLGQISSSLLAFTCWQQWLHLEMMIEAPLNGQTRLS